MIETEELAALLFFELKDDVVGVISREGNVLKITFGDGTVRTVTVE